jgi:hypothetical protein
VHRRIPPPDFRYVWLMPGAGPATLALAAAATAAASSAGVLWTTGYHPASISALLAGAALAAGALTGRSERRPPGPARSTETWMAVVPWGVVVNPDTEPRVLRWPAIRAITVEAVHAMRGGTPTVVASVVTVDTGRERLTGRTPGAAGLEGLIANLEAYAEEASRPVALDLEGFEPGGAGATEPVMRDLLARAGEMCTTSRGAVRLVLPSAGYRSIAAAAAGPETLALLRSILAPPFDGPPAPADPRALACIVAVLLGARDLVPDLVRLVSSPHPVVAAVAKAAAIRLGAPRNRAGAIDEVAAFLFEEDYLRIGQWAEGA